MKVRFLLDENLPPRLKTMLLRLDRTMDVLLVGDLGAAPKGTLDPEILRYLEVTQRALVTENRASMPNHIQDHWAAGGQIWGLFWVRPNYSYRRIAQELHLIWAASEAHEYIDWLDWIPFSS